MQPHKLKGSCRYHHTLWQSDCGDLIITWNRTRRFNMLMPQCNQATGLSCTRPSWIWLKKNDRRLEMGHPGTHDRISTVEIMMLHLTWSGPTSIEWLPPGRSETRLTSELNGCSFSVWTVQIMLISGGIWNKTGPPKC